METHPESTIVINEANFPDPNFRSYLLAKDYGEDGVISESEIQGITSIDVSSNKISSLKGIEYFTALTKLWCYSNHLTSLDVSTCTALTYLACDGNQLTSIDVSKNTALTGLNCYNNQLTSLDVSKNTALDWLYCYSNQLTSLDVSKNTALTELYCYSNQLTSLDVSKNTALTELSCGSNQLTSLDVSGCTALTNLYSEGNKLTALDLSKNTALELLYCSSNKLMSLDVSHCTALTFLACENNEIAALNVSNCSMLTTLYCDGNQLTSLDISDCTALTKLTCKYNQLTSLDASKNAVLEELMCYSNQLTSLDASGCTALTKLDCYKNKISGKNMDDFINSLPKNETEEERPLRIIDNSQGDEGNECTKSQVAAAKAKGWTPYYYDATTYTWKEYEGSDDEPENDVFVAETIEGVKMTFQVLSHEGKVCQVGTGEGPAIDIFVAGSVTIPMVADGYTVVNIGDRAFQGCSSLLFVSIPESVTYIEGHEIFMGCNSMAALKWDAEEWMSDEALQPLVENPNLLLYVRNKEYVPDYINNVVVNGEAESITLQDASEHNNFYCPEPFIAKKISYTHNYSMTTGYKTCQGWETIVLPFDVTAITNKSAAMIVPFAAWGNNDDKLPFWLCTLTQNGWQQTAELQANTPYIISMPNNEMYDEKYNLGSEVEGKGDITFMGVNAEVRASDKMEVSTYGNQKFIATFQRLAANEEILPLNVNNLWSKNTEDKLNEGSTFVKNLRDVRPFEAYMMVEGSPTRYVPIVFDEETTGISIMHKTQDAKQNDAIYDLQGRRVTKAGKGIYIGKNGRKVVLK